MRPIAKELMQVWITPDGKRFFDGEIARKHYRFLRRQEQRERINERAKGESPNSINQQEK